MSDAEWKFKLNYSGGSDVLLRYPGVQKEIEDIAQVWLSHVHAQFVSDFGFEGTFELKFAQVNSRMAVRIVSADGRTDTVLKNNPGWLSKVTRMSIA